MAISRLGVFVLLLTCAAVALSGVAVAAGAGEAQLGRAVFLPSAAFEEPQVVTIAVTDKGFDPNALQVKLEQGRPVELKFEFQEVRNRTDEHVFELGGLGLRSDYLSADEREVSLKFVPSQLGSVVFYCTVECDIHSLLQDARIEVVAPGSSGGPVVVKPTAMTLASLQQVTAGDPITVWATLRDSEGRPIPGALVSFYASTELFPDAPAAIGSATTDAQGLARFDYKPRRTGELTLQARFEGGGIYETSQASYSIKVTGATPAYVERPKGLEAVARWAPKVVIAVLLVIWSTYGLVVYQIIRISQSKAKA